ncbi:MAG TPA: hypothetical protein VGM88_26675 [Kofleriaceae bacterium]|jgi:hypothetical protein
MRWLVILLVACSSSTPDPGDPGGDDQSCPSYGCSTCPFEISYGVVTCDHAGDTCVAESEEFGCSCTCDVSGYWDCTKQDANAPCPGLPGTPAACGAGGDSSTCYCDQTTWICSTCDFGEGTDPVACTAPGSSCVVENWEHGCDCTCDPSGYWSCAPETLNSQCPMLPP